jgi:hypothetical protein
LLITSVPLPIGQHGFQFLCTLHKIKNVDLHNSARYISLKFKDPISFAMNWFWSDKKSRWIILLNHWVNSFLWRHLLQNGQDFIWLAIWGTLNLNWMAERPFWVHLWENGAGCIPMPTPNSPASENCKVWSLAKQLIRRVTHARWRTAPILRFPDLFLRVFAEKQSIHGLSGSKDKHFRFWYSPSKIIFKINWSFAVCMCFHRIVNGIRFKELSYQGIQTMSIELSKNRILAGH